MLKNDLEKGLKEQQKINCKVTEYRGTQNKMDYELSFLHFVCQILSFWLCLLNYLTVIVTLEEKF